MTTELTKLPTPRFTAKLSKDGQWATLEVPDWTDEMWAYGTEQVYDELQMREYAQANIEATRAATTLTEAVEHIAKECDGAEGVGSAVIANRLRAALAEHRNHVEPSPPATLAVDALRGLLRFVDRETCTHEEARRGGAIWTICDACGMRWADDRGGFQAHEDAPEVAAARRALTRAATVPQGVSDGRLSAFTGEDRFKSFHQSLCVRFGYVHDEEFWWRDLVSLEEHIAKQRSAEPIGYVRGHELQGFTLGAYGDLEVRHDRSAGDLAVYTSADGAEPDAARWREVSDKAWFVDAAGYAYGLREGSFSPTVDEDDVIAAIDAAMTPAPAELGKGDSHG